MSMREEAAILLVRSWNFQGLQGTPSGQVVAELRLSVDITYLESKEIQCETRTREERRVEERGGEERRGCWESHTHRRVLLVAASGGG